MTIDWKTALHYAELVKIAESVKAGSEYSPLQINNLQSLGYAFTSAIFGSDLATDVHPDAGDVVTFGYIAFNNESDELVIAIRGTDTLLEWAKDADFLMVPAGAGIPGATDDGFSSVYKSLRVADAKNGPTLRNFVESISEAETLTICGHSLGGALATLLSLDVARNTHFSGSNVLQSYTFASPRVGDHAFADAYNKAVPNTFRIANRMDLVSMLPSVFPLPYEHVAVHYEIRTKPPLLDSIACLHHLDSYLWLLSQLASVGGYDLDPGCVVKNP